MSSYRIPGKGRVDHGAPVSFTFDGKTYRGLRGDTVASALLAHGVHLMGRIMDEVTFRRTSRGNVCSLVKRLEAREGREAR